MCTTLKIVSNIGSTNQVQLFLAKNKALFQLKQKYALASQNKTNKAMNIT